MHETLIFIAYLCQSQESITAKGIDGYAVECAAGAKLQRVRRYFALIWAAPSLQAHCSIEPLFNAPQDMQAALILRLAGLPGVHHY